MAFILSMLGAFDNAAENIAGVEAGLDNWLGGYADGRYVDILKDAEESESMQSYLVTFTFDAIAYSLSSLWHSFFLLGVGYLTAYHIMNKMVSWENKYRLQGWIPLIFGFKAMSLGTLVGTISYFAGNVTKNTAESVMLSLGFTDHEGMDDDFAEVEYEFTNAFGETQTDSLAI